MTAKWSTTARRAILPIFDKIIAHPFITELMDGTLPKEKFLFYLRQDAIYLADFGRTLAGIASKCQKPEHVSAFLSFAGDTMEVEKALHKAYLGSLENLPPISPTCLLYTSFMLRQLAVDSLKVAVATVLPCFWIYKAVGDHILAGEIAPGNPYQSWIDTYGGVEYGQAVTRALAIGDEMAAHTNEAGRREMTEAFVVCSRMEWMFWDSAYKLEKWDI
ncbi:thiaminase II [Deltaproteobacteria bacterium Smac51]|nr:thiaminase II [Deltaproteobacteria bacterium Smac51]